MNISKSKILVTGASGTLGKQLLYELTRSGCRPVAHVRQDSNTTYIDSLGLEKRVADLRNSDQIAELVQGIDGIIHTAAWVNFRKDRLTQFTGINTFAAIELFKAARKAGVQRFVQVSSIVAVAAVKRGEDEANGGKDAPEKVTEDTPFNLDRLKIPYIMTKRAAEEELLKLCNSADTPELVIVNPSMIVAPSRTGKDREKALRKFSRFIVPNIPNRINLVDLRDVAPAIVKALEKGLSNERYILAGDNITVRELVLTLSSLLGRTPHLFRFPRPILDAAARLSLIWGRLKGRSKISFYPDIVKLLDYDWAYSSMKARRDLDFNNRPVYRTLEDLLTNSFQGTFMKPAS